METTAERMLTGNKAMAEAIAQEMERDPNVFVMGEDVGKYGGIFGSTEGLLKSSAPAGCWTPPSPKRLSSEPQSAPPPKACVPSRS